VSSGSAYLLFGNPVVSVSNTKNFIVLFAYKKYFYKSILTHT